MFFNTGCGILDTGFWILDTRYWILVTGFCAEDFPFRGQGCAVGMLDT